MNLFDTSTLLSVVECVSTITLNYGIEGSIDDRLELSYTTFVGAGGNTRNVRLINEDNIFQIDFRMYTDKNVPLVLLTFDGVHIKVRYSMGDMIEKIYLCDSQYMFEDIDRVGRSMCIAYN